MCFYFTIRVASREPCIWTNHRPGATCLPMTKCGFSNTKVISIITIVPVQGKRSIASSGVMLFGTCSIISRKWILYFRFSFERFKYFLLAILFFVIIFCKRKFFCRKLEIDGTDEPTGVFYFTHSHMIMLFLTAMGIGKDSEPLTAANFREMDRRNWRSSLLVPFAANFVAVFHR